MSPTDPAANANSKLYQSENVGYQSWTYRPASEVLGQFESVRLVKALASKLSDGVKHIRCLFSGCVPFRRSFDELLALGIHFRLNFLAHGPAQ